MAEDAIVVPSNIPSRDGYYWISIAGGLPKFQIALWIGRNTCWSLMSGAVLEPADNIQIVSRVKEPAPDEGVYLVKIHNPTKMVPGIDKLQVARFRLAGGEGEWCLGFKDLVYREGWECDWVEIIRPLVSEEELS